MRNYLQMTLKGALSFFSVVLVSWGTFLGCINYYNLTLLEIK